MIGNHEAGFDLSAQGTCGIAGRGGIVADGVIDANLQDGVSIGNIRLVPRARQPDEPHRPLWLPT